MKLVKGVNLNQHYSAKRLIVYCQKYLDALDIIAPKTFSKELQNAAVCCCVTAPLHWS